jgi:hypothetical protein
MLRAVPRIRRIFALRSQDRAIRAAVAILPNYLIVAVGTVDGMALVITVLRAKDVTIRLIDHCAAIGIGIAGVAVCGRVGRSAFGIAMRIGAADLASEVHNLIHL